MECPSTRDKGVREKCRGASDERRAGGTEGTGFFKTEGTEAEAQRSRRAERDKESGGVALRGSA